MAPCGAHRDRQVRTRERESRSVSDIGREGEKKEKRRKSLWGIEGDKRLRARGEVDRHVGGNYADEMEIEPSCRIGRESTAMV